MDCWRIYVQHFEKQFSTAMKNLNVLLFFDLVIPTLGICPVRGGGEWPGRGDSDEEERERKRNGGKGSESVPMSARTRRQVWMGSGLLAPLLLRPLPYSLASSGPQLQRGAWRVDRMLSLLRSRRASSKFNIAAGSSIFFQHCKVTYCL